MKLHQKKIDQLQDWLQRRKYTKTHQVIKWGDENLYPTAERAARRLAERGVIERMDPDAQLKKFGKINQGVWVNCEI